MSTRLPIRPVLGTFIATVTFEAKMYLRGGSLKGLVVFNIVNPVFALLTSWIPYTILGRGGTTLFASVTGMNNYLSFAVVGAAFSSFVFTTTYEGARAINQDQWVGTLEALFSTPASRTAWILGKIAAAQVYGSVAFVVVFILGVAFFGLGASPTAQLAVAGVGLVFTLVSMIGVGLILSGVAVVIRQDNLFAVMLWPVFLFLGGFFFPVQSLPSFLQPLSWSLPITYGLDMTRRAVLLGQGFDDFSIANDLVGLLVSSAILIPVGFLIFHQLIKRGQRKGLYGA